MDLVVFAIFVFATELAIYKQLSFLFGSFNVEAKANSYNIAVVSKVEILRPHKEI